VTRSVIAAALVALAVAPTSAAGLSLRQADVKIPGDERDDVAGYSVAGLGDVNGDRVPDFAIAAPRTDVLSAQSGSVFVVYGRRSVH
jgi:hypothetical protein